MIAACDNGRTATELADKVTLVGCVSKRHESACTGCEAMGQGAYPGSRQDRVDVETLFANKDELCRIWGLTMVICHAAAGDSSDPSEAFKGDSDPTP